MTLKKRPLRYHLGLRAVKTALAVTIAAALASCFSSASVFYAAVGAMVGMDRTLTDSLKSSAVQLVGVFIGGLFGLVITELLGQPPALFLGLGVLGIIVLCNLFRVNYAISLACIVLLSACTSTTDSVLWDTLFRLRDTALGLVVALLVNITIQPYNNSRRIVTLLQQMIDAVPELVRACVLEQTYPDLRRLNDMLDRVDEELRVLRRQRFFRRKPQKFDSVYLSGCRQLGLRILQELEAICFMDTFGNVGVENAKRLAELGLELPDALPKRKCTKHDTIVMNYHLEKLLDARLYLQQLITPEE